MWLKFQKNKKKYKKNTKKTIVVRVVIFQRLRSAAEELTVSSWESGAGELPSCLSSSRTCSHFTQSTKTLPPASPPAPSLSPSLPPLPSLLPLHTRFPFLSPCALSSLFPYFCRNSHTMMEATSSWPLVGRHFLSGLWRPVLGPVNSASPLVCRTYRKRNSPHSTQLWLFLFFLLGNKPVLWSKFNKDQIQYLARRQLFSENHLTGLPPKLSDINSIVPCPILTSLESKELAKSC